jgi:hypothetical protein
MASDSRFLLALNIFRVAEYIASYVESERLSIFFLLKMQINHKPRTRIVLFSGNSLHFAPGAVDWGKLSCYELLCRTGLSSLKSENRFKLRIQGHG